MKKLYQDALKQHYQNPMGQHLPINTTHQHDGFNGNCGDEVTISLQLDEQQHSILAIGFESEACAICVASASLLCEMVNQKNKEHFLSGYSFLKQSLNKYQNGKQPIKNIQSLTPLLAIAEFPSRVQCALLPWETALQAFTSPVTQPLIGKVAINA